MTKADDAMGKALEIIQAAVARDPTKAMLGLLVADKSLGTGTQYAALSEYSRHEIAVCMPA